MLMFAFLGTESERAFPAPQSTLEHHAVIEDRPLIFRETSCTRRSIFYQYHRMIFEKSLESTQHLRGSLNEQGSLN